MEPVTVIGAGLAGSECAFQLARRGVPVRLCEMKPVRRSPGTPERRAGGARVQQLPPLRHVRTAPSACCTPSCGALGSVILGEADRARVPAGEALAVDRVALLGRRGRRRWPRAPGLERVAGRGAGAARGRGGGGHRPAHLRGAHPELRAPGRHREKLYFYDSIAPIVSRRLGRRRGGLPRQPLGPGRRRRLPEPAARRGRVPALRRRAAGGGEGRRRTPSRSRGTSRGACPSR